MQDSGIYEIRNRANGKRYVGSATSFKGRWATHLSYLRRGIHHNRHLQAAWNKHGEPAFLFGKLLYCAPADLLMYEQRVIDGWQPEYNISPTAGSCLGSKWSDEAKARVAETRPNDHMKGRKHTAEAVAAMSAAQRGNTATKGKKRNPEAVQASAAAHIGMKRSPETRARISAAMRGKKQAPRSAETRRKLSEALRGKSKPPITDEHRRRLSEAQKLRWAALKAA